MATAIINLSSLNGSNGFRLDGEAAGDYSGGSVSNAGDINGDGFDDVIVVASGRDPNGGSSSGSGYVVFGKATDFDAALNLSSLDGSNGFRVMRNRHMIIRASHSAMRMMSMVTVLMICLSVPLALICTAIALKPPAM